MSLHEIVLPETKPETEWVRGRPLQKMSPTYDHARLQTLVAMALVEWAEAGRHGRVGTEWRFRVAPPGEIARPLVPDVAYLAYADVGADVSRESVQVPLAAPTLAVEVLSPDDRRVDVDDKVVTYLAAGTRIVLIVDPAARTIVAPAHDGTTRFDAARASDVVEHDALPGFRLNVRALFDRL